MEFGPTINGNYERQKIHIYISARNLHEYDIFDSLAESS